MEPITAKVTCTGKTANGEATSLNFQPDYADGRNAAWSYYTPSLKLSMNVRTEVAGAFEVGGRYVLTFTADTDETDPEQ